MNDRKIALISGAFLGLSGVIAGAMGAHALEKILSPELLDSFETAVRFQMYHAILLLIIGFGSFEIGNSLLKRAIWAILVGTLLFSGSIYVLVLTPIKVGIITPIGGTILIIGWGMLLLWGIKRGEG